ncbi:MAG: glycosyl hydrolase [Bacteriophage sp.]|jgi:lysozyme family protein|nr:MAG: glycosyl hydrolase [Bacteriophage sp.]
MAKFDKEFDKVILAEGGYVNDPDDAGGETYLGISRKNNPKWVGWEVIDDIKKKYGTKNITSRLKKDVALTNSAKLLYKQNYWDVLELDDIPSQGIAHQLFDTCVNCGKTTAIRIAQQVLMMTITGKWSDELKYNLMKYGNNK